MIRTLTVAALTAALVVPTAAATAASAPTPAATAKTVSAYHPYSAPVWYPLLNSASKFDCAESNPGCSPSSNGHTDDSITIGTSADGPQPVTAAGAGIVHIVVDNVPDQCPSSGAHTLGNYLWIDHGAGVASRYSHLQINLSVTDGQLVSAGQVLGKTGNSGLTGPTCGRTSYLNFQIQHNVRTEGIRVGTAYPIGQLKACSRPVEGASQVLLPSFQYPQYTSWNQVPQTTTFSEPGTTCVPTTVPNTPPSPRDVVLANNGAGRLKLTWGKPTSGPTVKYVGFEFEYYSTSLKRWGYIDPAHPFTTITAGSTFPTTKYFTGLKSHVNYRVRVLFNGGDGWSLEGYWKTKVTT